MVLLVDNDTNDQVDELGCSNALSMNICDLPMSFPIPVVNCAVLEDPAGILYTSSSTGAPKGIALTHEKLRVNVEGNQEEFRLWPHDHLLQQIIFSFDFSVWQVFMALANAASLFIAPLSKRGDPVALVESNRLLRRISPSRGPLLPNITIGLCTVIYRVSISPNGGLRSVQGSR